MANRAPFAGGEWYHCYNRGVDKRTVFSGARDYARFIQLLYLCNSVTPKHRSDLYNLPTNRVLEIRRGPPLVAIGAFCLMPNHFHILLKERAEGGISRFMQKMGVAYSMYFNIKNDHTGNVFLRPFRSRHVSDDQYFQHVVQYIHCNPAELHERGWKDGNVKNLALLQKWLEEYPHSSLGSFHDRRHPLRAIVDNEAFDIVRPVAINKMLREAAAYYEEINNVKMTS